MKVAVLPFNAAEGTKPAYGRQFAAFAGEQLRNHAEAEINGVSYLTQVQEEEGVRMAFVNISDGLLPYEQLRDLFEQADVELVMDGMLAESDGKFDLTVRFHAKDNPEPVHQEEIRFGDAEIFTTLHHLVKVLAAQGQVPLPEILAGETMEFGTSNGTAFLNFLEGFDGLNYIQQSNGQVAKEFNPEGAFNALLAADELDADFEGTYQVAVALARACSQYRIGTLEGTEAVLNELTKRHPKEFPAYFALGELMQSIGNAGRAADFFEKAVQIEPNDPGLISRLGIAQLQSGMPVNAERNFRRALELEDESKPSADYLAAVLQQTGRDHEVPGIWKAIVAKYPESAQAHVKYAMSLIQTGKAAEGEKVFESALETIEDNAIIKRYYAPYLAQAKQDFDRAMDFYEDALDTAPNDVPTLMEYAQTLEAAGREHEVPQVLKNILASEPEQDIRATTLARLIELEQPKRVESVENASAKMESGDFQGALRDLKPLRNWLADYWKLWALLASAYNRTEQYVDAEEASMRLLQLYPGCEPGYGEAVQALGGQGKHQEAYFLMRQAAGQLPQSLPVFLNLGLAAKRVGNTDEARALAKQIREALAQDPNRDQVEPILVEMES